MIYLSEGQPVTVKLHQQDPAKPVQRADSQAYKNDPPLIFS
ncbi:hypothetical protein KAOT1_03342 [Kordia algicida OT-1]|uniref:Uncharacterized protein n=1 Tax=Kordia algicida OT-1 TaxID=391587 RepID=A9DVE6_9FLAO|nr:hypothetical protein KAOT1_03342 [Kordia algicida OT-1]